MKNGLRHGSVLSPRLYCFYSDKLNKILNESGIGCHVNSMAMNNFSYADDIVLLCPCAAAINGLLSICYKFALTHYITFNVDKTEAMVILPKNSNICNLPDIILAGTKIKYVTQFKYLGHIISASFRDDIDIIKEIRNLHARGNTIIKQFKNMNGDVKVQLFKSFGYPLYCASLWSTYKVATISRLRVSYNSILRRLLGVKLWNSEQERVESMTELFAVRGIKSLTDLLKDVTENCSKRIEESDNSLLMSLINSDARHISRQWHHWYEVSNIIA